MVKFTIEGFSQEYAMTLKKEVEHRGKIITRKIDCTDLVILRWFVDFYPNMRKMYVDGKEYAWLTHKKLMDDLPLIDINKRAFIDRMQKLVEFNILTYRLLQEGGTFSLYGFGENYINLIASNNTWDSSSNNAGCAVQTTQGYVAQPTNKDSSINNSSIKDTSIKDKQDKSDKNDKNDKLGESNDSAVEHNQNEIKNKVINDHNKFIADNYLTPTALTKMVIKEGYIAKDDPYINDYNYFLLDAVHDYGFEQVRDCISYFFSMIRGRRDEIDNRYAYFVNAMEQNLKKATLDWDNIYKMAGGQ